MKKLIISVILVLSLVMQVCPCFAKDVTVMLDNEKVEFDVSPQIIDGRTLVPLRAVFEKINANVTWVEEGQIIIITKGSRIIAMEVGKAQFNSTDIIKNETEVITLDVPPQVIDGRTLIPIRAAAEEFGLTVGWDDATWTVLLSTFSESPT